MLRSLKEYFNEYSELLYFYLNRIIVPLEFNFRDILIKMCNQSARIRQAGRSSKLVNSLVNEAPFSETNGYSV